MNLTHNCFDHCVILCVVANHLVKLTVGIANIPIEMCVCVCYTKLYNVHRTIILLLITIRLFLYFVGYPSLCCAGYNRVCILHGTSIKKIADF